MYFADNCLKIEWKSRLENRLRYGLWNGEIIMKQFSPQQGLWVIIRDGEERKCENEMLEVDFKIVLRDMTKAIIIRNIL